MEQVAHVGYSTPAWRATPNLPTCAPLLFWRRPTWRLLAEERRAYRWLPGLPSSPPLSSGHLPPDTSAPEVVCKVLKNQHNLLTRCHEINSHEINSQEVNLPRDQLSQDLVRVDLVAIDLVRIDLVKGSQFVEIYNQSINQSINLYCHLQEYSWPMRAYETL